MFAASFAPQGWAMCAGQLIAIAENDALFSLIGTTYGGDGVSTFALPDLRGRLPVHAGAGPGLSSRTTGETFGSETVTVSLSQMPPHNHVGLVSSAAGAQNDPSNGFLASSPTVRLDRPAPVTPGAALATGTVGNFGGSQPHENLMPFLCVHFIIALFGIFPPRT
jgi:microcystin-dependent protein